MRLRNLLLLGKVRALSPDAPRVEGPAHVAIRSNLLRGNIAESKHTSLGVDVWSRPIRIKTSQLPTNYCLHDPRVGIIERLGEPDVQRCRVTRAIGLSSPAKLRSAGTICGRSIFSDYTDRAALPLTW